MSDPVKDYPKKVEKELQSGNTTEHSHRPGLNPALAGQDSDFRRNDGLYMTGYGHPAFLCHSTFGMGRPSSRNRFSKSTRERSAPEKHPTTFRFSLAGIPKGKSEPNIMRSVP